MSRVADLAGRLSNAVGRRVQPVRLDDARRVPALMADVLADGRVLVDRDDVWRAEKRREAAVRARVRGPWADEIPELTDG